MPERYTFKNEYELPKVITNSWIEGMLKNTSALFWIGGSRLEI